MNNTSRREFLKSLSVLGAYGFTAGVSSACSAKNTSTGNNELFFKISLAEWSLHRMLQEKKMNNLDFPAKAKNDFGISAVEYVNIFFKDKAKDATYLAELKQRCDDNGVTSVLIMCDGEGAMADLDVNKRKEAVENHYKWVDAAMFLGCHSIRVNCYGEGSADEVAKAGTDGLHSLSEYAAKTGINIIVENHGGFSSNGEWLSNVIANVNLPNCGTLPDFGNFCLKREKDACAESYDRYKGIAEMMPFAKGVSAKSYDFDENGNCIETDYSKMLPIVKAVGYTGHIGIEYEGNKLSEEEGIRATKKLLERVGRI
jgi:sugar phosphate isomerase/epimerase